MQEDLSLLKHRYSQSLAAFLWASWKGSSACPASTEAGAQCAAPHTHPHWRMVRTAAAGYQGQGLAEIICNCKAFLSAHPRWPELAITLFIQNTF